MKTKLLLSSHVRFKCILSLISIKSVITGLIRIHCEEKRKRNLIPLDVRIRFLKGTIYFDWALMTLLIYLNEIRLSLF